MKHLNEETIETSIWRAEDEQELRELLAFIPDANPCDLAVMCRKRCYEVYFHRKNIYPDNEILKRRYNENLERRNATLVSPLPRDLSEFENRVDGLGNPILDSSHNPCIHQGSCGTEAPNCSCYTSRHYCRRECRCPQDCPYRIPGCHCKVKKGIACNTTRCPCREAGRECDPERCISCDARACGYNGITNCRNVRMQQEQHSQFQIEIKPSERHGNGAFACKSARKNQLIGEYVGEIQGRNTTDEYQIINNFRELNYIFDFKEFEVLNSATMGNELRYLNHDSEIFNCKPEMMQVNGDLRIGIVSTKYIKKGEELFLDYGEQYWSKTD
ncbi:hypothetical protein F5879DRAFT_258220 [Lentinula edodes]|nr:hypothetical protein F5879DRAFT_258220 [Lentinula edodes]